MVEESYYTAQGLRSATHQLLPCPFCAGDGEIYPAEWGFVVRCWRCTASIKIITSSIDDAIAAWNMRRQKP